MNQHVSAQKCLTGPDGKNAYRYTEQDIAEADKAVAVCEKPCRLQCKSGEGGKPAADADFEKQNQPGIDSCMLGGQCNNGTNQKSTDGIDAECDQWETVLRLDGQQPEQITADGTEHAAETDEQTIYEKFHE